jgi:hypothetical protein
MECGAPAPPLRPPTATQIQNELTPIPFRPFEIHHSRSNKTSATPSPFFPKRSLTSTLSYGNLPHVVLATHQTPRIFRFFPLATLAVPSTSRLPDTLISQLQQSQSLPDNAKMEGGIPPKSEPQAKPRASIRLRLRFFCKGAASPCPDAASLRPSLARCKPNRIDACRMSAGPTKISTDLWRRAPTAGTPPGAEPARHHST